MQDEKNMDAQEQLISVLEQTEYLKSQLGDDVTNNSVYSDLMDAGDDIINQIRSEEEERYVKEGGIKSLFEYKPSQEARKLLELRKSYRDLIEEQRAQKREQRETVLKTKEEIVSKIEAIVAKPENVGKSFKKLSELRQQWSALESFSGEMFKAVDSKFSHLLDHFYYHANIYSELRDRDFDHNLKERNTLIEAVSKIKDESSIRRKEDLISLYTKRWDEAGPVRREAWNDLKTKFWSEINSVYDSINQHYQGIREQREQVVVQRKSIIEEIHKMTQEVPDTGKAWNSLSEKINEKTKIWFKTGSLPKSEFAKLKQELDAVLNPFYEKKKSYFKSVKDHVKDLKGQKEALIEKAIQLKDNDNWRETTEEMKRLQGEWKKIAPLRRDNEQKLWTRFREAMDAFFDAKRQHHEQMDLSYVENLKQKEALLSEMNGLSEDKISPDDLSKYSEQWQAIGHVPRKDLNKISRNFEKAITRLAKHAGMEGDELDLYLFKRRLKQEVGPGWKAFFSKAGRGIKDQIGRIKDEIVSYENNLHFFRNAKNADSITKGVDDKIEKMRKTLSIEQKKLDILNSYDRTANKDEAEA